jgi:hypothetical protein
MCISKVFQETGGVDASAQARPVHPIRWLAAVGPIKVVAPRAPSTIACIPRQAGTLRQLSDPF